MLDYKVIPNFLPKEIYQFYWDYFFNLKLMDYRYMDAIGTLEDKSGFFFSKNLFEKQKNIFDKELFLISTPLFFYAKITYPTRVKVNCFVKQSNHIYSSPHRDQDFPHKTLLYSVNTNNGFTVLDPNGENLKIPSVANQALFFDGGIEHQAVTQTDENIRVNININY